MTDKPKIQYVREFYNYGTEAKKLDFRSFRLPKSGLPMERLSKAETVTLDPVAMVAIVAAVVLLIVMAVGITQIQDDWTEYDATRAYVSHLRAENARLLLLLHIFHDGKLLLHFHHLLILLLFLYNL